jgi:amino acid transporter
VERDSLVSSFAAQVSHSKLIYQHVNSIRFGLIVGQVGTGVALLLVLYCALGVSLTLTSISAIASNDIPLGGVQSVLVTTLGTGIGYAITLVYTFGVTVFAAIEIVGSVSGILSVASVQLTSSPYWDQVLLSLAALVALGFACLFGHRVVHYVSITVFSLVLVCLAAVLAGLLYGRQVDPRITGPSWDTFIENFGPPSDNWSALEPLSFLFPCFVGIYSGANHAADLKNPFKSIPRGGFAAIAISTGIYSLLIVTIGFAVPRVVLLQDWSIVLRMAWPTQYLAFVGAFVVGQGSALQCLKTSATLIKCLAESDTLSSLKRLQLARVWHSEPIGAIAFASVVISFFLFFSDLESLAVIVSMSFLLCYALTNISCALLSLYPTPSWRPAFRAPWSFSLLGFIWCFLLMFQLEETLAVLVSLLAAALAVGIQSSSEISSWGMGIRGMLFHLTISDLLQREQEEFERLANRQPLTARELKLPSWRPHLVCFIHHDTIQNHSRLIHFVQTLKMKTGICILASVITAQEMIDYKYLSDDERNSLFRQVVMGEPKSDDFLLDMKLYLYKKIEQDHLESFIKVCIAPDVQIGQSVLLQTLGLGDLNANTVVSEWPILGHGVEDIIKVKELFQLWDMARMLDYTTILCKGIATFPVRDARLRG